MKLSKHQSSRIPAVLAPNGLATVLGEGVLAVVHDAAVVVGRAECGYLRDAIYFHLLKKT